MQRERVEVTNANQVGMNLNILKAAVMSSNQVIQPEFMTPKKHIHRYATKEEIGLMQKKMHNEESARQVCEIIVHQLGLEMAILDVKYQ